MPVDPIAGLGDLATETADWVGPEFALDAPPALDAPADGAGAGFGSVLVDQIGALQRTQDDAAAQAGALATGQAEDVGEVVMAVERAQLAMQLASQMRGKAVEAYQEIFRTQV